MALQAGLSRLGEAADHRLDMLATGLEAGPPEREPEEQDMRQQWVTRDRFEAMVRDGVITDDSTLAAYALLLLHEQQASTATG